MSAQRLPGLPARVEIYEVGPRDGLQNEKAVVPVAVKAELVRRLVAAGLRTVELTSFVPKAWPRAPVLVPNLTGLERALSSGAREIAVFASATETFAQRNLNRTVAQSLAMFAPVVARARAAGLPVRGYVSMCFGDPWEGAVPLEQVAGVALQLAEMGCTEVSLGDTIGVGTPGRVVRLLDLLGEQGLGTDRLAVHFHDTYGQALANTLVALENGVTTVDASAGGLGGCPYAGSATGNLATEDLVWMLHGLGIETGVDLGALVATSTWVAQQLGRPSPSRTLTALTPAALTPPLPRHPARERRSGPGTPPACQRGRPATTDTPGRWSSRRRGRP